MTSRSLPRRAFLKLTGIAVPLAALLGRVPRAMAGWWEQGETEHWNDGGFVQNHVDLSNIAMGAVRAEVDGQWDTYHLTELDDAFMEWNLNSRLEFLDTIATGQMPGLAGPHAAAVATYGAGRRDSRFTLNNAVKGMGLAPKREHLGDMIEKLQSTMDEDMPKKLEILKENYRHPEWWDRSKQISLELYAHPDFETHTFLNIMTNPIATLVFTDMPSYELRAIVRIVHPQDESAGPGERDLLRYCNLAHDYFHGETGKKYPLLAFHIIEQFDNSPGSGRGVRRKPPLPERK
jgi:hypothetical protein